MLTEAYALKFWQVRSGTAQAKPLSFLRCGKLP
jgi:hypothetical protein